MFKKDQFKDKVVIVTGSGGGIGKSHAIAFAKAGAKVIVNDLGSARDGKGATHNMADQVVNEIKGFGGTAVANYDSVADAKGAENIVKTAIDSFGRLDIVVNNAGILRDKTFLKMTDDLWDIVIAVHLKGTYNVTKAAAPIMKEQNHGRIINTTSMSGLLGNFGQTNYGAAKAGIYGFTRSLSMELERFNITVNNIAPVAKTRMTEDIEAVPDEAKPEQITPMVMYLASDEASSINGRTFGVHGQLIFEYYMEQTKGYEKKTADLWTLDEIHEKLSAITDKAKETAQTTGNLDSLLPKLNDTLKALGVKVEKLSGTDSTATASVAAPTEGSLTLSMMFQKFSEVFVAEKAAGFDGLIQFVINGDEPEALYIKDGKVTIKAEMGQNPACTITTDKQSMLEMLDGKADPTKLYMKGKIKADKLPIMMKFNAMFNTAALPSKLKDLKGSSVPSTPASPQESGSPSSVASLIQSLALVFVPEKAGGFDGAIQFLIKEHEPQAIYVTNQKVTIKQEKAENPKLTLRTDKETLQALFKGELDANKAVMTGKIKADQMSMLMKFANMFNLKELPQKMTGSGGSSGATQAPASEGMNRSYIGKWFYGEAAHVKPDAIKKYAKATNDSNNAYFKDKVNELLVPPVFPVTLDNGMLEKWLTQESDLNMDFSRMVHGEQEIKYFRPLKPWDLVYPVAQIADIETKPSGETLTIQVTGKVRGQPVYQMNVKLFVRALGDSKSEKKQEEVKDLGKPLFTAQMKVDPDQSKRYADASGDYNPIHLDPEMAKSVGLPDIILHGLCTMAFASQAIVKNIANNDPRKLKQINVRFSRPVLMNDILTTKAWLEKTEKQNGNQKRIIFETTNEKGVKVLSNGHAVIE